MSNPELTGIKELDKIIYDYKTQFEQVELKDKLLKQIKNIQRKQYQSSGDFEIFYIQQKNEDYHICKIYVFCRICNTLRDKHKQCKCFASLVYDYCIYCHHFHLSEYCHIN